MRSRLRRLVLVRPGDGRSAEYRPGPVDASLTPLDGAVRARMHELLRHWEFAEAVVASPLPRAAEAAAILSGGAPVRLDADLRPLHYGRWQGLTLAEMQRADPIAFEDWQRGDASFVFPGGEALPAFRRRVALALARLEGGRSSSLLVVTHGDVIRELVVARVGHPLPPGRPWPGELALATHGPDGWQLGRRSSDPAPLQSALEREGLGGIGEPPPERHVATFELRARS